MRKATARHILVETQSRCESIKSEIEKGADFAAMAREYSLCPSGERGGDLGEFYPGQMVAEFDKVVFNAEKGKIHGPVETQFGYHLIDITSRSE
jgi:peptidyl-prolyl cis-trans isomerase C